jgi:hypothetical protein
MSCSLCRMPDLPWGVVLPDGRVICRACAMLAGHLLVQPPKDP